MASISDFCSQLESLTSIDSYLLATSEGRTVSHTLEDPDQANALIALSLLEAEKIRHGFSAGRICSLTFDLSDGEGLILFALGKWILLIRKKAGHCHTNVYQQVEALIDNYRKG